MKITLNLGAHYSGTEALTLACTENPQIFGHEKVSIWGRQDPRVAMLMKLARDPGSIAGADQALSQRALNLLKIHVEDEVKAGADRIIIDAVNLLGTRQDNLRMRKLYRKATERLDRVLPAFADHDLQLCLIPRAYDAYWSITLFEAVSHGVAQPDDAVLDYLVTQPTRWRHLVEALIDTAPKARMDIISFEAFGNRPQDALGCLFNAAGRPVELNSYSAELAEKMRVDPVWNTFEAHQLDALRAQYREDVEWFEAQNRPMLNYHRPQRTEQKLTTVTGNQTVIRPRRVTLERGNDDEYQKRAMG
ncbi:hypothetical protein [Algirhabdus cladophorae]|uniref:hypothetical protein n=1 Tax=Algirhabdus cladophorae TaxID=3377108 RepID=UPI003B847965